MSSNNPGRNSKSQIVIGKVKNLFISYKQIINFILVILSY